MPEFETTISAKGQITIPKELRQLIGLQPGDKVRLEAEGEAIKLTRTSSTKKAEDFQEVRTDFDKVTGEKAASEGM